MVNDKYLIAGTEAASPMQALSSDVQLVASAASISTTGITAACVRAVSITRRRTIILVIMVMVFAGRLTGPEVASAAV
jgi:hypothetical protein